MLTDAPVISVNRKQNHIWNFGVDRADAYNAMEKNIGEIKNLPFLKPAGILVHDHEAVFYHFGRGHAECNIHIIR